MHTSSGRQKAARRFVDDHNIALSCAVVGEQPDLGVVGLIQYPTRVSNFISFRAKCLSDRGRAMADILVEWNGTFITCIIDACRKLDTVIDQTIESRASPSVIRVSKV